MILHDRKERRVSVNIGIFVPTIKRDYNKVTSAFWIRAFQLVKSYENLGAKVHINNPFLEYDVAIFYRGVNRKSYLAIRFLKKKARKVYWDTCVNYYTNNEASSDKHLLYAKKISKIVDGVIVSSEEIGKFASLYNDNVYCMPDPVNINHF